MILIVIYILLVFLGLSEAYLSYIKRSNRGTRKFGRDRLSLLIIWVTIPVGVYCSIKYQVEFAPVLKVSLIAIGGIIVTIVGSIIRWTAINQLKENFTVDVSIVENHQLNTSGIFSKVRHPSYSGLLMNYIGIGIAMTNLISLLIISIPILIAINYRMNIEEILLENEFEGAYRTYMKVTKRIIPFLY